MNNEQKSDSATLAILQVIESNKNVTQRHLAEKLGVALGLANSYLKLCVRKGLIKIQQAPANRYFYYLTPKGFAEKSRLTSRYLADSFDFYRRASCSCVHVFRLCAEHDYNKILLCGVSELAEIATLRATEQKLEIIGLFDSNSNSREFIGFPVWSSFDLLPDFDACVITDVKNTQDTVKYLEKMVLKEIIFMPDILGIHYVKIS